MAMKIDAEVIEKRIEEIPGICADGKKAIKKLFEDGFGVEFKKRFKTGMVVKCSGEYYFSVSLGYEKRAYVNLTSGTPNHSWEKREHDVDALDNYYINTGMTLEEYFRKKFEGKL